MNKHNQKIGPYVVEDEIGRGGMGVVYRATDTRLDRVVAIKALPEQMAGDSERLARFEREARTLASLNHPNVAGIHGVEDHEGHKYLVLEFVDGETLAERLERGALPLESAIELGIQIATGVEAAHEAGIVHRDLKPANIKITPEGELKILDFGLARAYGGDSDGHEDVLNSPTITAAMTQAGVILGTAAYMSPEQARGESVDQRADLWAFGVILFEMLTGHQFFAGETVSDTLAAVLRADLDWDLLPRDTPPNVRRVLRRCLTRNPKDRLRSAADARLELAEVEDLQVEAAPGKRSLALPVAIGVLAASLVMAAWVFKPTNSIQQESVPTHLALTFPEGLQVASRDNLPLGAPQPCLAISDDGRLIVAVVERDGTTWLYRRFLDQPDGEVLSDTRGGYHPQISPDGENISFMKDNALMRMSVRGDRATTLIELPNSFGHTWINNDEIVVNRSEAQELLRVDSARGTVEPYERKTDLDEYFWPSRVPGMNAILFNSDSHVAKGEEAELDEISIMDLATEERTVLGIGGTTPRLLSDGTLLMVRDGILMAAPLDFDNPTEKLRPVPALEGLLVEGWIGQFAVSKNRTMVYVPGVWLLGNELVWDGGQGEVEPLAFPLLSYGEFELSPNGRNLAITVGDGSDAQVWVYDIERGARRLLTTDDYGWGGIWAPDGEKIVYGGYTGDAFGIFLRTVGSTAPATLLYSSDKQLNPYAWHAEAGLLFNIGGGVFRLDPDDPGEPELMVDTEASEWGPDISPDGRWFAYTSDESGRYEIYARAIGGDRSFTVSLDGGEEPVFSADGKSIYYRYGNRFYRTPILEASSDGTRFRAGRPEVVVEGAYSNVPGLSYDVGPDGRLVLLRTDGGTERPGHLNVILNWEVGMDE